MKKKLVGCFAIICFLSFAGCDNDNSSSATSIKGLWKEERVNEDINTISRLEINFEEGGTVQITGIEIDKDSGEILGYRSKQTGSYTVSGNEFHFDHLVRYSNDDLNKPYSKLDELIMQPGEESYSVTFEIGEAGKELIFNYPPCGPSENCIGTRTFLRAM